MRIIDIVNGPWAITPEMLTEIQGIYGTYLRGEKINIEAVEAKIGKPLENKKQLGYDLIDGAAIITIEGVIAKKMNLFSRISGGASTQLIERDIREALNDSSVEKIILNIDSPGGTVDGTFELANFVFESRGKKPIIAYTDGMMCSAAYAIGAAADQVFISGDTTAVGSIGVVASHQDISKMEEKYGVKTTEIYAGKYKRIASEYQPLTVEGFASIKERIDYLYTNFVNEIAKFRGVSSETVIANMSTDVKPYFIGKQAIEAGLVDGVSTLDGLINKKAVGVTAADSKKPIKAEETIMTKDELKEKFPAVYQAIADEGHAAGLSAGVLKGKTEGAAAELARIKSVKEQAMAGHEALIETLMFDGVTTGADAAVKVLAAEKTLRTSKADDFKADGKDMPKVPSSDAGEGAGSGTDKTKSFDDLVTAHMAEQKCSKAVAISAVAKAHPDAHKKWLDQANKK